MDLELTLATAHIEMVQAAFQVHVGNAKDYNLDEMNDDRNRPPFVLMVQRGGPYHRDTAIVVSCYTQLQDIDLLKLAQWVESHKKPR